MLEFIRGLKAVAAIAFMLALHVPLLYADVRRVWVLSESDHYPSNADSSHR